MGPGSLTAARADARHVLRGLVARAAAAARPGGHPADAAAYLRPTIDDSLLGGEHGGRAGARRGGARDQAVPGSTTQLTEPDRGAPGAGAGLRGAVRQPAPGDGDQSGAQRVAAA